LKPGGRPEAKLLRKIVAVLILVPLAVIIIAFAVANRQIVTVSLDPFSGAEPAASVTLPMFALILVLLIIGVVIGGVASWLRQGKWRGAARRLERELRELRQKFDAHGAAGDATTVPRDGNAPARLRLRPPAH
jgi:uncharacterized integral membrane protein